MAELRAIRPIKRLSVGLPVDSIFGLLVFALGDRGGTKDDRADAGEGISAL